MMRVLACAFLFCSACAGALLGNERISPLVNDLRIGVDDKKTVLARLGNPQRRFMDGEGREIFVYLWANGQGEGEECVIAFNTNGLVYLVDVAR